MSNQEIIQAIEWWQSSGRYHPLTCKDSHGEKTRDLVPVLTEGTVELLCPTCGYRQQHIPPVVSAAFKDQK